MDKSFLTIYFRAAELKMHHLQIRFIPDKVLPSSVSTKTAIPISNSRRLLVILLVIYLTKALKTRTMHVSVINHYCDANPLNRYDNK